MAGHSKWANIQHRKGRQDEKRGKVWTRLIREIVVAARHGGGDLGMNPRLRLAVEKAKAANMPADTIKQNIDKATGNLEGMHYEEIRYEGYGIGGAAIIVDSHDRQPRAHGGRGAPRVQQVRRQPGHRRLGGVPVQARAASSSSRPARNEDKVMEVALEAGADDVVTDDDGAIEVITRAARLRGGAEGARERRACKPDGRRGDDAAREHGRRSRATTRSACRSCSTSSRTSTTSQDVYHNARSCVAI